MITRVILKTPTGAFVTLRPGELIGRVPSCALIIDDSRISEAHAIVSLRGGQLWLLALRGRFSVANAIVERVALEPGQRVVLAQGIELEVVEVVLPDEVLALELPLREPALLQSTTSIMLAPQLMMRGGWHADAAAWLWPVNEVWRARVGDADVFTVEPGVAIHVGPHALMPRLVALDDAGVAHTVARADDFVPLRIHARFHSVHITRGEREPIVLTGTAARVVSELVALEGPVEWQIPAREVWGGDEDEVLLRNRWDATLSRLRKRLRGAGVRDDLIRVSGQGIVELVLGREDVLVDDT